MWGRCGTYAEYEGKYFMQERGFILKLPHAGSRPSCSREWADQARLPAFMGGGLIQTW